MQAIRRSYCFLLCTGIFISGLILSLGYLLSEGAAWSIIISSVNGSAWELTKPFIIILIFSAFLDLSCLRPSLLRYVSDKLISIGIFTLLSLTGLRLLNICFSGTLTFPPELIRYPYIFICICISQLVLYTLYNRAVRTELFFMPLLTGLAVLLGFILFRTAIVCY